MTDAKFPIVCPVCFGTGMDMSLFGSCWCCEGQRVIFVSSASDEDKARVLPTVEGASA